jgi:hypothetical protein
MKIVCTLLLCALLQACSNQGSQPSGTDSSAAANDTATATENLPPADKAQLYIWDVNSEQKTKRKNLQLRPEYYNVDTLILGLNEKYPRVQLKKVAIGHDTLYTKISDAQYLTEQMGSAGAEQYIAQAVLNLTAVNGINYVRIDFAEGSHASPDVWSKTSFGDYKETK